MIRRVKRKPEDKDLTSTEDTESTCNQTPDLTSKQQTESTSKKHADLEQVSFGTSFLETEGKIPGLFDVLWRNREESWRTREQVWVHNPGMTLQIDLREEDLAKAMAYYSYHISKKSLLWEYQQGVHESQTWKMFRSAILKGYNKHYKSFDELHHRIKKISEKAYGENYFEIRHLDIFPPLIMVFFAGDLVKLAEENDKSNKHGDTYEYIRQTFMDQVHTFVKVGPTSYKFILEIVHSGLGLGYNKKTKKATNPLNGSQLKDKRVITESLVDRAMIVCV